MLSTTLISTEVNAVLVALSEADCEEPLHFGKYFIDCLVTGHRASQIAVNYPSGTSLARAIGTVSMKGFTLTQRSEKGYTFAVGSVNIVLRKKQAPIVTDFDVLTYEAKNRALSCAGQPLSEELRAKFAQKRCTLQFDPYEKQDAFGVWVEKRKALLSYIRRGWIFLDGNGNKVSFSGDRDSAGYLNPNLNWVPTVEPLTPIKGQLTLEDFHKELEALIKKYATVLNK